VQHFGTLLCSHQSVNVDTLGVLDLFLIEDFIANTGLLQTDI